MGELTKLGRYQLKRVLGRGAMGVVYEGLDPSLNRRVAVKTILKNAAIDEETAQMYSAQFAREAQAAGRLNHPNIVGVHDFAEEGSVAYLVMEYIQGRELRSYFEAKEKFDIAETVRIMGELLDALEFAHEAGVIHRDIKPANVMLDAQRRVKLADFGVARIQDSERSAAGTMVGTPAFMSPEQISGGKIDRRTDLFSAGTILYQLLTGDQPFTGAGAWTVAKKIMQDDPPQPSSVVQSVSPVFDAIVDKALAKKPAERYASAKEFAAALRATMAPAAMSVPPATPAIPVPKAKPRPESQASEAEVEFWRAIQNSTDAAEFEFYLEQFPEGMYAGLARHKIARLTSASSVSAAPSENTVRLAAEAAEKQRLAEEKKAQEDAERQRQEAEEQARIKAEAEAFAKQQAEEHARREAAAKAQRAAEEKAKREAQEKARREAEAQRAAAAKAEAEARARKVAEELAQRQAAALVRLKQQEEERAAADPEATVALSRPAAQTPPPAEVPPPKKSPLVPALIGAAVVIAGVVAFVAFVALNRKSAPEPVAVAPAPVTPAPVAAAAPAAPVVDEAKIRREVEERIRREYADKSAAEQVAASKAATEKAIQDKQLAAKGAVADKAAAEKVTAEKAAAEKAIAEKLAAAKSAGEKAALEKAAAERAAAEAAAAEKAAAEKAAAAKAAGEKLAAEKAAAAKAAAAHKPGWPAVGDKWTYETKDSQNPERRGHFTVEVKAVGPSGIADTLVRGNGQQVDATHGPGIKLNSVMPGIVSVNPYLRAFQELAPGQTWRNVDYGSLFRCNAGFDCTVNGRVVGREKVSVKAGTFDAVKVVFDVFAVNTSGYRSVIEVRYWFAEAVNRFVKYELRTPAINFSQPLMDQELVSYTPAGN